MGGRAFRKECNCMIPPLVLHASWVSRCVEKQFSMPISLFVLDDYFNSNQIGLPSTSNLHHSSSWTDASSNHSASTTPEPSEPVPIPFKRRFHDMNSPSQENDYSPARTRPKKRQRIHTSDVNDPDNDFTEFPVSIRNLKPLAESVSKNHFLPSQDPLCKRDASQQSASSDLSCSSLPSRACLSLPSVTIQSFPRIDLRRTLSLNHHSPLKLKNLTPLRIRSERKLTAECDNSSASAFTSFWNQISKESIRRVSSGIDATEITPILVSALPDMVTTISTTSGSTPTSPEPSTIFLPGKLHLGKKFCAENKRTR
ncbi:hypothetical protein C8J55DRAFT_301285 [Lentinula edodes]|uniref:Uncharacterized protein n=1 Tax=Lentinula lateritia TaxID=40482 RepID=A0A9W9DY94_9AGAR|nr:hypothetical protein C8J55DRAFT_301285 [Lentinula edodes]